MCTFTHIQIVQLLPSEQECLGHDKGPPGVLQCLPQVWGSLSWINFALSAHSVYYSLKGKENLHLEGLFHTNTQTHKHTTGHTCTYLCTRESHSHTGFVMWVRATLLLALSFFRLASHFSVIERIQFLSLDGLCFSLCPSVSSLVLASAYLLLSFSPPDSPSRRLFAIYLPLNAVIVGLRSKFSSDYSHNNDRLNFCFSLSLSLFFLPSYLSASEREISLASYWTSDINMTHEDAWSDLFMCNEFRAAVWCGKNEERLKTSKVWRHKRRNSFIPSKLCVHLSIYSICLSVLKVIFHIK